MIDVRQLFKRFGGHAAVDGLSFHARDGSITGILGDNGAGKTTTLALVCGLLTPDEGSIEVDGAVRRPLDLRRRVGALLDHQGLYPRLTARENIAYFAELQGLSGADRDRRIDRLVTLMGLDRLAGRPSEHFSQGERLKVAIARAIVHDPRNLLLDEATNGLDIHTVRSLRALLGRMRDEGRCIVFSSHVLDQVRAICDHIVVIAKGRVVSQGDARTICEHAARATLEDALVALTSREAVS